MAISFGDLPALVQMCRSIRGYDESRNVEEITDILPTSRPLLRKETIGMKKTASKKTPGGCR